MKLQLVLFNQVIYLLNSVYEFSVSQAESLTRITVLVFISYTITVITLNVVFVHFLKNLLKPVVDISALGRRVAMTTLDQNPTRVRHQCPGACGCLDRIQPESDSDREWSTPVPWMT